MSNFMQVAGKSLNAVLSLAGVRLVRVRAGTASVRVETPHSINDIQMYRRLYSTESVEKRRFYNIGAGKWRHPVWTNVDKASEWYRDHQRSPYLEWDLFACDELPIESESAELFYTSHVVEHVTDTAVENLFGEAYRALKPGGTIRITCPDTEQAYLAWKRDDRDWYNWISTYSQSAQMKRIGINTPMRDVSLTQIFLYLFASSVSTLHVDGIESPATDDEVTAAFRDMGLEGACNLFCSRCLVPIQEKYPGNHMNWFTKAKLHCMLQAAGFSVVVKSTYGQSNVPVLRNVFYFDFRRPNMSLYVEAQK